mgnify:CR=1 FL=1
MNYSPLQLLIISLLLITVFTLIIHRIKWTRGPEPIMTMDQLQANQISSPDLEENARLLHDLQSELDNQIASSYQNTENLREQIINGYLKPSQILKGGALNAAVVID